MSKKVWMSVIIGLAIVAGMAFAGRSSTSKAMASASAVPQTVTTGEWTASMGGDERGKHGRSDADKLHLNFERGLMKDGSSARERNGRHQIGQSYDFSELQGLSREQVASGGPVRFSLVREAGRIDCEGSFQNGKGSGTFTFTSNPQFVAGMKSRGFDFEADAAKDKHDLEDRLFTAAALNLTTALADDLASAGFGKLTVEDLFKAAIFKVDSNFMREMKASGFPNLGMEDLVKARIFKIDAEFVRQVTQMGFDKEPFESLVKMQIFKVTPEFIGEMRNEGLTELSIEELVKLRIFKIDSEFIRKARAEGVPVEVERLVQKRIGVARRD